MPTAEKECKSDVGGWGQRKPFYTHFKASATWAPLHLMSNDLILITAVNNLI